MSPVVGVAVSGTKVAQTSEDLQRFLFSLHQGGGVRADAAERVGPFGAGGALRVEAERRWVEEDALALDLFDHGSLGEHVLEGLATRQAACVELEPAELRKWVVLVFDGRPDAVLGAQVPHEDGDHQGVGLVPGHLDEAAGAEVGMILLAEVPEVLHLEKATRSGTGDPGWVATPGACGSEGLELLVNALQPVIGKVVQSEVENSPHVRDKAYALGWGSSRRTAEAHRLHLPGRGLDVYGQSIGPRGEQEFTANRTLDVCALLRAQAEGYLQLGGLARPLGSEKDQGWIGRHDCALIGAHEVARILGCEHQRAVVLADASCQVDDKAADGRVFKEKSELVDDEHAPAVLALDASPESAGEQIVDGRDHLVAELTHAKGHDWSVEVYVGL